MFAGESLGVTHSPLLRRFRWDNRTYGYELYNLQDDISETNNFAEAMPERIRKLDAMITRVSGTHTMRYHAHYHTSGMGRVDQQRSKSFPIQEDEHFFVVCRYVERNALRAGLVDRLSTQRGKPLGDDDWVASIARRLNLQSTLRPRGRPRVRTPKEKPNKEA